MNLKMFILNKYQLIFNSALDWNWSTVQMVKKLNRFTDYTTMPVYFLNLNRLSIFNLCFSMEPSLFNGTSSPVSSKTYWINNTYKLESYVHWDINFFCSFETPDVRCQFHQRFMSIFCTKFVCAHFLSLNFFRGEGVNNG